MRIHKDAKLEKVVSKEDNRAVLNHINIVSGDPNYMEMGEVFGRAVATDGRRLVVVPVTLEEGDFPGVITPESLAMCRKLTNADEKDTGTRMLLRERSVIADNTSSFPRKSEMMIDHREDGVHAEVVNEDASSDEVEGKKFPSMDVIDLLVPPLSAAVGCVTLNPKYLLEIAEAMGSKNAVTLYFYENNNSAIRVEGADSEIEGAVGVLMAIRNEDNGGFSFLDGVTREPQTPDKVDEIDETVVMG